MKEEDFLLVVGKLRHNIICKIFLVLEKVGNLFFKKLL